MQQGVGSRLVEPRRHGLSMVWLVAAVVALSPVGGAAQPALPESTEPAVVRVEHRPADAPPTLGPPSAMVQVELFFLPGVTSARIPLQLATELWRNHPERVRVVFRILPRQGHVHLPVAALEAAAQGKFFAFLEGVVPLRSNAVPQLREVARAVGMDLERLDAAWLDNRYLAELDANEQRRARLRTRQTPEILFSGKLASRPVSVLSSSDAEAAYREAYERALDALDRGVPRSELAEVLEREALADRLTGVVGLAPADERSAEDDLQGEPSTNLLSRPLRLTGLPSRASKEPVPAGRRTVSVIVACNPLSVLCHRQLQYANAVAAILEGSVRLRWAPMFDPRGKDAAAATMASDALLCAEAMGAGWTALDFMTMRTNSRRGRAIDANAILDQLIEDADVNRRDFAHCLAVTAGDSARRATELRERGVVVTPTVVVGGRMYPGGVSDSSSLQSLVQLELTDGWIGQLAAVP